MIPPKIRTRLAEIEAVLGYKFTQIEHLLMALTHISALNGADARLHSYQRLEFLGDHVLGLTASDMLYKAFPQAEEGELSKRLAELVRSETCAEIALELGLDQTLRLGQSEMNAGVRKKQAVLGDICEAVFGAVYLDGGFIPADRLIRKLLEKRMHNPSRPLQDAKTALQEWAQKQGLPVPHYVEMVRKGPDHAPIFTIQVDVIGYASEQASGASKRIAEQLAASTFLKRETTS
jgi:ribonuclease III